MRSETMNTTTERTEALLDRHGKSVTAEVYWDTGDPNGELAEAARWEAWEG
jgi:hypothetical protein